MSLDTYVNRGRCWASDKANVCITRTPSRGDPDRRTRLLGFRTFRPAILSIQVGAPMAMQDQPCLNFNQLLAACGEGDAGAREIVSILGDPDPECRGTLAVGGPGMRHMFEVSTTQGGESFWRYVRTEPLR